MGRSPGRIARLTVSRCKVGGPLAEAISDHLAAIAARGDTMTPINRMLAAASSGHRYRPFGFRRVQSQKKPAARDVAMRSLFW